MPIRFACEHCNSTLSVSSRKAGHQVMCPKCRQPTPVPVPVHQPAAAAVENEPAPRIEKPAPRSEPAPKIVIEPPAAEPASKFEKPAPRSEPAPKIVIQPPAIEPAPQPREEVFIPPEPIEEVAPAPQLDELPPDEDDGPDEVTWVYEGSVNRHTSTHYDGGVDFDRVSLPRYVLYGQGVLLIAVAMVALTLGIMIGRGTAPRAVEKSDVAVPCQLTGEITYASSGGTSLPDSGAVVIVVPKDRVPDEKAPVEGLRPQDPLPASDHPALARLTAIGSDYVRADEQGRFKLRVPDTGDYFLLVISRHAVRKASDRHETVHLAEMGRYFIPAPDLPGDRQYRWRAITIKRDQEFKFAFQ